MTLDQPIKIQRKTQAQQANGSLQTVFTTLVDGFAMVRPMRGSERNSGDQTQAVAGYVFHIHYRSDLLADDVIVWNGNTFNIRFIADMGMGSVYLRIEAERGVAV